MAGADQRQLLVKRFNEFVGKRSSMADAQNMQGDLDQDVVRTLDDLSKENDALKPNFPPEMLSGADLSNKDLAMLQGEGTMKRQYEFVGKRPYELIGKRRPYDFIGKRRIFLARPISNSFLGKKSYDFLGKRTYDFLGKRVFIEFPGKGMGMNGGSFPPPESDQSLEDGGVSGTNENFDETGSKRYAEFLGKRKRTAESGEAPMSDLARLAVLLQNPSIRKRVRMLLNQGVEEFVPEFIGK